MSFIQFCQDLGILLKESPPLNTICRYPTIDKPRSRNGAIFWDGRFGWAQNHATMDKPEVYVGKNISLFEKKKGLKLKKESDALFRANQEKAILKVRDYYQSLSPLKGLHPYLAKKKLSIRGCSLLRADNDKLIIPIFGPDNRLMSIQSINSDGKEKRFAKGCPIFSGHFVLGKKDASLFCLAEGFATGLAIYQSLLNCAVIVCFNAANLETVAKLLRRRLKDKSVVICADNDYETEKRIGKNPGILNAQKAAKILGCDIAYPEGILGTDFSDALVEWESAYKIKSLILRKVTNRV